MGDPRLRFSGAVRRGAASVRGVRMARAGSRAHVATARETMRPAALLVAGGRPAMSCLCADASARMAHGTRARDAVAERSGYSHQEKV